MPWLPMVVNFFLTHLLLEVASLIIFLPSSFCCHDLQEAKDSKDEEDPRPTSSNGATSETITKLITHELVTLKGSYSCVIAQFITRNSWHTSVILIYHIIHS